jgi:hypothetical protein
MEALGKREKRCYKRGLHVWNDELSATIKTKKEAYLQYINSRSEENRINYKRLSTIAKRDIRKIRRQSWEKFVSNNTEYGVNGRQIKAYKILKKLNKTEKDNLQLNLISEKTMARLLSVIMDRLR